LEQLKESSCFVPRKQNSVILCLKCKGKIKDPKSKLNYQPNYQQPITNPDILLQIRDFYFRINVFFFFGEYSQPGDKRKGLANPTKGFFEI
jgi:hypothetical protein